MPSQKLRPVQKSAPGLVEARKSNMGLNLVLKVVAGGLSSLSSPRTRVFLLRCVLAHCPVKA